MTFAPIAPTIYVPPTQVAKDTFVIHQVQPALGQPLFVYINSMVILGKEPVIVDTGTPANRTQWLEDVFSLVEPERRPLDLPVARRRRPQRQPRRGRWTACPNAQLVCNWAMVERHTNCFNFPLDRCRWVMDGESLDVGDRTLQALRPPVYDSPTTRGLFDPTTGVYWAVDTFATPLPDPKMGIADLDAEFWDFGMALFALGAVSPWLDDARPRQVRPLRRHRPGPRHHHDRRVPHAGDRRRVHRAGVRPGPRSSRRSTRRRCPTSRSSTRSSPRRRSPRSNARRAIAFTQVREYTTRHGRPHERAVPRSGLQRRAVPRRELLEREDQRRVVVQRRHLGTRRQPVGQRRRRERLRRSGTEQAPPGAAAARAVRSRRDAHRVEDHRGLLRRHPRPRPRAASEQLDESVDGEWSFLETLRHLVFATDRWITGPVLDDADPFHRLGLPNHRSTR